MSSNKRKAFHFDLDEQNLKQFYPSKSKNNYKNAWGKISSYMKKNGFKHTQYSGYESIHAMSQYEAIKIIENLNKKFPWFEYCAKAATITDIGKRYDILQHLIGQHSVDEPPMKETDLDSVLCSPSLESEADDMRRASQELSRQDDLQPPLENDKSKPEYDEHTE